MTVLVYMLLALIAAMATATGLAVVVSGSRPGSHVAASLVSIRPYNLPRRTDGGLLPGPSQGARSFWPGLKQVDVKKGGPVILVRLFVFL